MREKFRQSMSWLHTWSGLILGWLIFVIFFTGTLSYFRHEITHWMQPETHGSVKFDPAAVDKAVDYLKNNAPDEAAGWLIALPDERTKTIEASWRVLRIDPKYGIRPEITQNFLDASTGENTNARKTHGGEFLYRFHIELYGMDKTLGRWIIGIATMALFIAIITGIILHKRIFKDFFVFRGNKGVRSWIDAHIFTAVLALPYHIMITYSGLLLLMMILLPWNTEEFLREYKEMRAKMMSQPVEVIPSDYEAYPPVSLVPLLKDAEERLGEKIGRIYISNPGRRNMTAQLVPSRSDKITYTDRSRSAEAVVSYNLRNGRFYGEMTSEPVSAAYSIFNAFSTLHVARFADTFMRWLFFISGVMGTVMTATGLIIWTQKKAKAADKPFGRKLVEVLNIGGITGLAAATAAYFWANRFVPAAAENRMSLELWAFFGVWVFAFIHPAIRDRKKAWVDQLWLCAGLYALIPAVNALTSSMNLFKAFSAGNMVVAGFDLTALAAGVLFAVTAVIVSGKEAK
jgi:uncharacterized iron-regulated membrane protein